MLASQLGLLNGVDYLKRLPDWQRWQRGADEELELASLLELFID